MATSTPADGLRSGTIVTSLLDHRLLRAITAAKAMLGADAGPTAQTMLDEPRAITGPLPAEDATTSAADAEPAVATPSSATDKPADMGNG